MHAIYRTVRIVTPRRVVMSVRSWAASASVMVSHDVMSDLRRALFSDSLRARAVPTGASPSREAGACARARAHG